MVPISPGASVEHLIEISMPKNRPIDSKFFLFILRGSKKIVKKIQTKIQSATWSKYTLKNTKNSKKSKILRLQSKCHKSIVNNSNQNSNKILMNP